MTKNLKPVRREECGIVFCFLHHCEGSCGCNCLLACRQSRNVFYKYWNLDLFYDILAFFDFILFDSPLRDAPLRYEGGKLILHVRTKHISTKCSKMDIFVCVLEYCPIWYDNIIANMLVSEGCEVLSSILVDIKLEQRCIKHLWQLAE